LAVVLAGGAILSAPYVLAQDGASTITSIQVDASGNLIMDVGGEGFDPLLEVKGAKPGPYRITLSGENVTLAESIRLDAAGFSEALSRQVPAVTGVKFMQEQAGVRLVLDAWRPLHPRILSNTGSRITIELVGDHSLPPGKAAVLKPKPVPQPQVTDEQKQEEAQRQAILRRLAAQREQEEQREAELKRIAAERLAAEKQAAPAQPVKALPKPVQKTAARLPQPPKATPASTWQPAARHINAEEVTLDLTPASKPSQPSLTVPRAETATPAPAKTDTTFTPKALMNDRIPAGPADNDSDGKPTEPLKLKATPPEFEMHRPQPAFQQVYRAPDSGVPDSLYTLMKRSDLQPKVREAWQAVQQGDLVRAETGLRDVLEKTPDDAAARYLLARVLLKPVIEGIVSDVPGSREQDFQARREAARQELLKIVTKQRFLPAYLTLMDLYLDEENTDDAGRLWEKMTAQYPEDAAVLYEKGRLNEALGDMAAARDAYISALTRQPDNAEFHYRLAQVELKANRLDAAHWELNQALALAPDDGRFWKLMGYIAEKQNDPQKAAQFYREAAQPDALINYGRLLEGQNQPEKALAVYVAAENLAGDDTDILFNLGMIYNRMKREDRAEATLKRFLDLEKDTRDSRVAKARSILKQMNPTPAGSASGQLKILPF
jgi:Tfp pilus assembly protein PilF